MATIETKNAIRELCIWWGADGVAMAAQVRMDTYVLMDGVQFGAPVKQYHPIQFDPANVPETGHPELILQLKDVLGDALLAAVSAGEQMRVEGQKLRDRIAELEQTIKNLRRQGT